MADAKSERDLMDELDEAIGKLSAAALQSSPNDDQIIADHVRDSVALLLKARHKLREDRADKAELLARLKELQGVAENNEVLIPERIVEFIRATIARVSK